MQIIQCTMELDQVERRRGQSSRMVMGGDILHSIHYWRRVRKAVAGHTDAQYRSQRQSAMRPVLGQLRMIESAIKCDLMCRNLVATMRGEA